MQRVLIPDTTGLDGKSNWVKELERQVGGATVMLSVIGEGWAGHLNDQKQPALHDPSDFVRFEIAGALSRDIKVYPVLVDGAALPDIEALPKALWPLTLAQSKHFRTEHVEQDVAAIAKVVDGVLRERAGGMPAWAAGGAGLALLSTGIIAGPWTLATAGLPFWGVDVVPRQRIETLAGESAALQVRLTAASTAAREAAAKADQQQRDAVAAAISREQQAARDRITAAEKARSDAEARAAKAEGDLKSAGGAASRLASAEQQLTAARDALSKAQAKAQADLAAADSARVKALADQKTALEAAAAQKGREVAAAQKAEQAAAAQRAPKPGEPIRDCNDVCPEMVVVPAGKFMMGEGSSAREVSISQPFAVGKFEVTFAEWDACVAAGGCKHKPDDRNWGRGRRPVINVSWNDAKEYVAWLSRRTGQTYRLLTEAEWEYAARAGNPGKWTFGDDERQLGDFGWYRANAGSRTQPVGGKKPNAFGLHDMHGNVWEWVEDANDPSSRVFRGGAWSDSPQLLRSALRNRNEPTSRYGSIGFRVARVLVPARTL